MARGAVRVPQVGSDCDGNGDISVVTFSQVCASKKKEEDAVLAQDYVTCTPRALSK